MGRIEIEKMSKVQKILGIVVLFMTTNSLFFLYKLFVCPNHILMFIMEKLISASVFKNSTSKV